MESNGLICVLRFRLLFSRLLSLMVTALCLAPLTCASSALVGFSEPGEKLSVQLTLAGEVNGMKVRVGSDLLGADDSGTLQAATDHKSDVKAIPEDSHASQVMLWHQIEGGEPARGPAAAQGGRPTST